MKLKNKVALITGASSGIGRATAIALAKEGCTVIVNFKTDEKSAREVVHQCELYSTGNTHFRADISKEAAIREMMKKIKKKYGSLHVLVNNAGTFNENDNPTNIKVFESMFRENFLSHIMVITHALKIMKRAKIVNVSSIHGKLGFGRPSAIAYAAFKASLESYTKNLAKQLAPRILVNAVAPGRVATPMWGNPSKKQQKKLGEVHLIKRMIQPEEIADAIVFIAKNDAMCAEILAIDGGYRLAGIS